MPYYLFLSAGYCINWYIINNIYMLKRKQYDSKIILSHTEEHESPRGFKGLIICKNCSAAYFKKSWHHNLRNYKDDRRDQQIKFLLCPACKMVENKQFEGEITICDTPVKIQESLMNLIEAFCHRAYLRDSQHRLISVRKVKNEITATTTENQLAKQLAKKIQSTFKTVKMKISYSPTPGDAVYIKLTF